MCLEAVRFLPGSPVAPGCYSLMHLRQAKVFQVNVMYFFACCLKLFTDEPHQAGLPHMRSAVDDKDVGAVVVRTDLFQNVSMEQLNRQSMHCFYC
ncbi:MAG: hypothetical protein SWO11_05355 [Thermodesulfobacteriota bacterium]|nr:hypothetical protein [Thermodesulfobacteriota bacterium]